VEKLVWLGVRTPPIPPMPIIPRTFFCGSWPSSLRPRHFPVDGILVSTIILDDLSKWKYEPALTDRNGAVILRRAPIMRNMAISAVALLTATGVFATEMPIDTGQSS
jgi:hypothetical protein